MVKHRRKHKIETRENDYISLGSYNYGKKLKTVF
jgi:hypothetical protein